MCVTFRRDRKEDLSSLISLFLERQVRIASDPVYGNIQDRPIRATERPQIKAKSIRNSFSTSASIVSTQQPKGNRLQLPCKHATAITHYRTVEYLRKRNTERCWTLLKKRDSVSAV